MHDLPKDPSSEFLRDKNNVAKFHKFVFVSNWQMQAYISEYQLPWDKCIVIQNAIDPIEVQQKPDPKEKIRFMYHSNPRKGLNVVVSVFEELCKKFDNIHLDVYSSFNLYGWNEMDKHFQPVWDAIDAHPQMTNHGFKSNDEVRKALADTHIWLHPATFAETSCLCLMEAMSAGCICVHSNYGAMFETGANWTQMYPFVPDLNQHAKTMYQYLQGMIPEVEGLMKKTHTQKSYADIFYNWDTRKVEWQALLQYLVNTIEDTSPPKAMFTINTEE